METVKIHRVHALVSQMNTSSLLCEGFVEKTSFNLQRKKVTVTDGESSEN